MPAPVDVDAERAATPGCATVVHLNNAGAALPTRATLAAIADHLDREARHGGYEAAASAAEARLAVQRSAEALLGAGPGEVAITASDTDAWSRALWGFVLGGGLSAGDRVLVDRIAYDSHYLALLQACRWTGAVLETVPSLPDGTLDLDALGATLEAGGAALVCATHVGTHRGLVNPVEEAGRRCRAAGVPYAVDACQSVGQLPVDVGAIGCDVLTATGRKWLRGPRGTGLLYVRPGFVERLDPPGVDGASAVWEDAGSYRLRPGAARFAPFEAPVALHLGLGDALAHALDLGVAAIAGAVGALAEALRAELAGLDGVDVHDGGTRRSGIVTFTVAGTAPADVVVAAAAAGVNVSATDGPAARLDLGGDRPEAVVRASPHYYNTTDEVGRLVEVVAGVARG